MINQKKKVNYITSEDNVSNIKVIIDYEVDSLNKLFNLCLIVKSIDFIKCPRNNIKDMSYMFHCWNLEEINFYKFY